MQATRRRFVLGAALLAAGTSLRGLAASVAGMPTAAQVIERIRAHVGVPWQAGTVDRIVAGSPGTRVTGIATTMMATLDVLRRAAAAGCNLVVAHEPTFYSHFDTVDTLADDPTYRLKRDFIAAHDVVVFRFHDHWHDMQPDGIEVGMRQALGWEKNAVPASPGEFVFPAQTLATIAATLATRLGAHSMRMLGDPALPVRRVFANWGYADLAKIHATVARTDIDLVLVGETREWELIPYMADQVESGLHKGLIVLNHVLSEQEGMRYCAQWLRGFVNDVPVEFIAADEPLRGSP